MKYKLRIDIPIENILNARSFRNIGMGMTIFFGRGTRDDWCAYIGVMQQSGKMLCAMPSDKCYFEMVTILAGRFGVDAIYDDIKHIFEHARKNLDDMLMDNIYRMSLNYPGYQEMAYATLMMLYYGMVSEENHAGTYLGRSIKMNGVHSLLKGGRSIEVAATECYNKLWREIQAECLRRHIYRV